MRCGDTSRQGIAGSMGSHRVSVSSFARNAHFVSQSGHKGSVVSLSNSILHHTHVVRTTRFYVVPAHPYSPHNPDCEYNQEECKTCRFWDRCGRADKRKIICHPISGGRSDEWQSTIDLVSGNSGEVCECAGVEKLGLRGLASDDRSRQVEGQ